MGTEDTITEEDSTSVSEESVDSYTKEKSLQYYIQNPEEIDATQTPISKQLVLLYYLLYAFPLALVRLVPFPIRLVGSFILGGYVFEYWDEIVGVGKLQRLLADFTQGIASIDAEILLLSSVLLIVASVIAYYGHRVTSMISEYNEEDNESEMNREDSLETDGGKTQHTMLMKIFNWISTNTDDGSLTFSKYGVIVGGISGILFGGIFGSRWVLPLALVGMVIGEEIGYRIQMDESKSVWELATERQNQPTEIRVVLGDGTEIIGQLAIYGTESPDKDLFIKYPQKIMRSENGEVYSRVNIGDSVFIPQSSISHVYFDSGTYN